MSRCIRKDNQLEPHRAKCVAGDPSKGWHPDSRKEKQSGNATSQAKAIEIRAIGWNVRSAKRNADAVLEEVNKVDLAILVETWLNGNSADESIDEFIEATRKSDKKWLFTPDKRSEGVTMAISKKLKASVRYSIEEWLLGVEIEGLLLLGVYVQPGR